MYRWIRTSILWAMALNIIIMVAELPAGEPPCPAGNAQSISIDVKRVLSERQKILQQAIATINKKTQAEMTWSVTPSLINSCIVLLGEMRASEAVDTLIDNVAPRKGMVLDDTFEAFNNSPASLALVKIGLPAIDKLIGRYIKEPDSAIGNTCLKVIEDILGSDLAGAKLQELLSKAKDPDSKALLERALAFYQGDRRVRKAVLAKVDPFRFADIRPQRWAVPPDAKVRGENRYRSLPDKTTQPQSGSANNDSENSSSPDAGIAPEGGATGPAEDKEPSQSDE